MEACDVITRSDYVPTNAERRAEWAFKFYRLPLDKQLNSRAEAEPKTSTQKETRQ